MPDLARRLGGNAIGLNDVMRLNGDVMRLDNAIRLGDVIRLDDAIRLGDVIRLNSDVMRLDDVIRPVYNETRRCNKAR